MSNRQNEMLLYILTALNNIIDRLDNIVDGLNNIEGAIRGESR